MLKWKLLIAKGLSFSVLTFFFHPNKLILQKVPILETFEFFRSFFHSFFLMVIFTEKRNSSKGFHGQYNVLKAVLLNHRLLTIR